MNKSCKGREVDIMHLGSGELERIKDVGELKEHLKICKRCRMTLEKFQGVDMFVAATRSPSVTTQQARHNIFKKLFRQGNNYIRDGRYQSAVDCFDSALLLNPEDTNASIMKDVALEKSGKASGVSGIQRGIALPRIDTEKIIGSAAEKIYQCLKTNGPICIPELRQKTGILDYPFYEAIGRLDREKKITIKGFNNQPLFAETRPEV